MDSYFDNETAQELYNEVVHESLRQLEEKRNYYESELANCDLRGWSEVFDFLSNFNNQSKTGLYCLVYKPTGATAYYGVASKMNQRVRSHVKGFNADGFVDPTKESMVGKKMFEYDSDLRNWGVRFYETGNRELALALEEHYYWHHKSMFNNPSMLGK